MRFGKPATGVMRRLRPAFGVAAVLAGLWSTKVLAVTGVLFESDAGDYIGQGVTRTFEQVEVSGSPSAVTASFPPYSATFVAPRGATLATGARFAQATHSPFNSPTP